LVVVVVAVVVVLAAFINFIRHFQVKEEMFARDVQHPMGVT
jgi:hypothetical protein